MVDCFEHGKFAAYFKGGTWPNSLSITLSLRITPPPGESQLHADITQKTDIVTATAVRIRIPTIICTSGRILWNN
jgi:hypothetical protein